MSVLGYVHESPSPRVSSVISGSPLPLGEYVSMRFKDPRGSGFITALAVVSNSGYRLAVPISTLRYIGGESSEGSEFPKLSPIALYVIAEVFEGGLSEPPRYPVPPDTPVEPASADLLKEVYGSGGTVRIGELAPRRLGVEIRVNPDKLAKHLFIAGATGSGKSNLVAILADRLSAIGAPVLIFDAHGEYNIVPEDGDVNRVHVVQAKINPLKIPPRILSAIIIPEAGARRQRRLLTKAIESLNSRIMSKAEREKVAPPIAIEMMTSKCQSEVEDTEELDREEILAACYGELLKNELSNQGGADGEDKKRVEVVKDKVEEFFERTPVTITGEQPTAYVKPGTITVVDTSTLDDEQKRWIVKILVDELLVKLKREGAPVVVVIEEAPLFLSVNQTHPVKASLQKFAREGRKFGGCLIVVSQRPRSLDVNVVSQLQNFVFLRMVQEEDIRTVMNIADSLDQNLANIIPTLPDGRAIVMGEWIGRFPALVDIDLHKGKRVGATPPLTKIWSSMRGEERVSFSVE
ncbi:MAG: ATP-binding protein [Thermoprotei archaeon]|nr:ATP-binding protein [Thermoprotei archaeon]